MRNWGQKRILLPFFNTGENMITFVTLGSGSKGNAVYIKSGDSAVLVDAGLSFKRMKKALDELDEDIMRVNAILLTHEHTDHVRGLPTLLRYTDCPVYATYGTFQGLPGLLDGGRGQVIKAGEPFEVEQIGIESFSLSHDARDPVGFQLYGENGNKRVLIATDTGIVSDELRRQAEGADLFYIESNYDKNMLSVGPYPYYLKRRIAGSRGHLCNDDCAQFIKEVVGAKTRHIVLGHLSENNNAPALALQAVGQALKEIGAEIGLSAAPAGYAPQPILF